MYVQETTTRSTIARLRSVATVLMLCLAACRDFVEPALPLATIRSVATDTSADGDIFLHVILSRPATLEVTYWDDPAHRLLLRVPEFGQEGIVALPELHAGRAYRYELAALNARGDRGPVEGGDFGAPELPDDLRQVNITATGSASAPLVMLEISGAFQGFVAIDGAGIPVWKWRTQGTPQGFTRRANGNFVFIDAGFGLFEVTPGGQVVHQLDPLPGALRVPHHDVVATPANTVLFIAKDQRATLAGDALWEWNPETGAVTQRFTVFDFYDPAVDWGARSVPYDWVHANSLALGDHGNVILSLNWLDQVISIAPDWKSIEWKAGGRASTFAFDSDAAFQGQHTAAVLADGHLLVLDNGRERADPAHYSRGLEVSLDQRTGTAHQVWSFRPSPDIYAPYVGAARRFANGNTLVFFGLPNGFSGGATGPVAGYEVTRAGTIVWTLTVGNVKSVYRATPLASIAGEVTVP